jgi:hypothetical protein
MFGFLKKKAPQRGEDFPAGPASAPVQEVIDGKKRGLTNDQVISKLKSEGYSFSQIQDAFSQAEIKSAVIAPELPPEPIMQPMVSEMAPPPMPSEVRRDSSIDEIERLLEEIIKEKWKEVGAKLGTLDAWKIRIDTKLGEFEKSLAELRSRLDGLQNTLTARNEEYGRVIVDTQTEIMALEKVMGKLVPSMTDSIKELRSVIEDTKKKPF